jgi:hypothetical protein
VSHAVITAQKTDYEHIRTTMQIAHLHMWRAALHVTVRYMSQERYVSRRATPQGAALVHGRAVHRCTTWTTLRKTGGGPPGQKYLVIAIW